MTSRLSIDNRLPVRRGPHGRYQVRTAVHRYHAWREVDGVTRDIVRYDNGHGSALHRHDFDADGDELRREFVSGDTPTIERVVREAIALVRGWLLSSE